MDDQGNETQGFASMSEEERKKAGRKGGQSQSKDDNPGNFAKREPEEVSEER